MPQSTIKKDPVWVRKIDNNNAHVTLRRNFEQTTETDEEGNEQTFWNYEETDVVIKNRKNLLKYINKNFETVWLSNPEELAKKMQT